MKLIKLDAIDSTNDFLKSLSSQDEQENFTVVTAENQTKGKGQMGAKWSSETGKNLIMSVLVKDFLFDNEQVFNLSIVVSLAVLDALKSLNIPDLCIKWPNDIMSYNKKIGGILIENTLKSDGRIVSVVGIGINVNQTNYEELPRGSSLAVISGKTFDKENLAILITEKIEEKTKLWITSSSLFWIDYFNSLFKKGVPMPFKNLEDKNFMGIIQGVSPIGKLQVLLEDDSVSEFEIKEIQMLY
ncbi:BirA family transcriptional regulator, biotin operon repressor / biotin-[acetyl-CoA-carboxylase] ligase [Flavobacterium sp. CF108]|uniref:biotin--[acetyl-CoA-carboxylase] ligase n=1 Tax=unclassified Flavobacterium TaxID=196869 RepID=UPI0008C36F65|nr:MULTISPECIES: biotin--[acetyl-CoA-carboxylase] ligase [unclassified Flavobacterium]SEP34291.1 BirA family transcriptional regulator, biotin operon repressor / biotin-[acetyl-CoA-carboxylase] ligase [Flavobacterium sp. fv08]SHG65149.1 BirA family transcriptional regulator, biotin operon repressor / biotin-[acetyl-CoA-carboxylase] ligase [Flavobacterium sp. CF108]